MLVGLGAGTWYHRDVAGTPKKRARKEAADGTPTVPEAAIAGAAAAAPAETGAARARARSRATRTAHVGAETRKLADAVVAGDLAELACQLQPGAVLRLERVRPAWCAGWLVDYPLEHGDLGEAYSYIAEEYGGNVYKATVLVGDQPMYTAKISVAGPPRDGGRLIQRWQWEGGEPPAPATAAQPPAQQGVGTSDMMQLFTLMLQQQQQAAAAQLAAVRESVDRQAAHTESLMQRVIDARAQEDERRQAVEHRQSLAGQLQELAEAKSALDKAGKMFTRAGAAAGAEDDQDSDLVKGALKEAAAHFATQALGAQFSGAPALARRRPPPPGANGVAKRRSAGIPDARPVNRQPPPKP